MTGQKVFLESTFKNSLWITGRMIELGVFTNSKKVVARYTAAIAVNFIRWMQVTIPHVRYPQAARALKDNLDLEIASDHVAMLLNFSSQCGAFPATGDYQHVASVVEAINKLLADSERAGLRGLALLANLEHTSQAFIPDLASRGRQLRCKDFTYTEVHGEADVAHAEALFRAVEYEMGMGYQMPQNLVLEGVEAAQDLIFRIYL